MFPGDAGDAVCLLAHQQVEEVMAKKTSDRELIKDLFREIIADKKKSAAERMKAAFELKKLLDDEAVLSKSAKPKDATTDDNPLSGLSVK